MSKSVLSGSWPFVWLHANFGLFWLCYIHVLMAPFSSVNKPWENTEQRSEKRVHGWAWALLRNRAYTVSQYKQGLTSTHTGAGIGNSTHPHPQMQYSLSQTGWLFNKVNTVKYKSLRQNTMGNRGVRRYFYSGMARQEFMGSGGSSLRNENWSQSYPIVINFDHEIRKSGTANTVVTIACPTPLGSALFGARDIMKDKTVQSNLHPFLCPGRLYGY